MLIIKLTLTIYLQKIFNSGSSETRRQHGRGVAPSGGTQRSQGGASGSRDHQQDPDHLLIIGDAKGALTVEELL